MPTWFKNAQLKIKVNGSLENCEFIRKKRKRERAKWTNWAIWNECFAFFSNWDLGRVRILIKIRLKLNFDRFTMEKLSNFTFNLILTKRIQEKTIFCFQIQEFWYFKSLVLVSTFCVDFLRPFVWIWKQ